MKRPSLLALALGSVMISQSPGAGLMVDFGVAASPVAAGFQGYATTNATPDPDSVVYTAASTGFSADVTLDVDALLDNVLVTSNTPPNLFRVIDRTATAAALATPNADLFRDWIGATQLSGQAETGLRITVLGLPAGTYNWSSWHHDVADQTGLLDVSFKVGGSAVNTQTQIDISNGTAPAANANNTPFLGSTALTNTPVAFSQEFTISLGQTVVFELSPNVPPGTALSPNQFQASNFTVINGLSIVLVPEPTGAILGLLGFMGVLLRRRR
jgi:hypothetical protein